jgi:Glycosyl hydrolases family 35
MTRHNLIVSRLFVILCATLCLCYVNPTSVSFDRRSFIIDGERVLLLSGSIHYSRVPPSDWEPAVLKAKELGLNCIQTYVFWNEHEPVRNKWVWDGYSDLSRFLDLIHKHNMYAVVRIGPYACGEFYFGGIPLWLRHVDNIQCFRCSDPIWKREMKRYTETIVAQVLPYFHAPETPRGPVIGLQIENEYFRYDEYYQWSVDMARSVTSVVPWMVCHTVEECGKLNPPNSSATHQVLCPVNGFWTDKGGGAFQPGVEFFDILWSASPNQPAMWTEDQGWFDLWNFGKRVRYIDDQLYGIARFIALGGSYHNFYMLSGGNNYGYKAGRSSTTAYAADTVIDSYLLRHEPKYTIFKQLHTVLNDYGASILRFPPAKGEPLFSLYSEGYTSSFSSTAESHKYGTLVFLSNFGENATFSGEFEYDNGVYYLPNRTVVMLDIHGDNPTILFNTSGSLVNQQPKSQIQPDRVQLTGWRAFQEKVGYGAIQSREARESPEQLNLTDNKSDYLWYSFSATIKDGELFQMHSFDDANIFYVYLNDTIKTSRSPFVADKVESSVARGLLENENERHCRIHILSVAMGLKNYDVKPGAGKGLKKVQIGNYLNITMFDTSWKLKGEDLSIFAAGGSQRVDWSRVEDDASFLTKPLVWFQADFTIPRHISRHVGGSQPDQTALVANLTGLNKGVVYVNGFLLGRYWLAPGICTGDCAPPLHGTHCFIHWKDCGKPTQSLYHIPFEILNSNGNLLTVFEEAEDGASRDLDRVQLQLIYDHPA